MATHDDELINNVRLMIESLANACPGGIYRLIPPVSALMRAILEIHLHECLDTERTYIGRYAESKSYRDDAQARYYKNAAGYLRQLMMRLDGGYKRESIIYKVIENLSNLTSETENDTSVHSGAVDKIGDGSDTRREVPSGDNPGDTRESRETKLPAKRRNSKRNSSKRK